MKALVVILLIALFISCEADKEDKPPVNETEIADTDQRTEDTHGIKDSAEAGRDTTGDTIEPPQISPIMKDENAKSISELWNSYKKAKNKVSKALDSNDIDAAIVNLSVAGESAEELGRMDIAAWQFNNIGHYSIVEFKRRTDYEKRLQKLATMQSGKEKALFQTATQELFLSEYPLLKRAEEYLVRAQIIDDFLEPSRRTEVIQRNIDFIDWIKEFSGAENAQ
jgi:hypothetical protein